ncbi:MAG: DUF6516 family protein [Caldilineaceae bacterium]
MRIEDYFHQLQQQIDDAIFVASSEVSYDKRGASLGFIRGDLILIDSSTLHFREFVDTQATIERDLYTYQYMDATDSLVFRYDNADHHRKLNLATHPHHKHDGSEANVVASQAPTLADVLAEIERLL